MSKSAKKKRQHKRYSISGKKLLLDNHMFAIAEELFKSKRYIKSKEQSDKILSLIKENIPPEKLDYLQKFEINESLVTLWAVNYGYWAGVKDGLESRNLPENLSFLKGEVNKNGTTRQSL